MTRLADSDIVLDVCPTSNLLLSVYPSLAEHPLPELLDAGIRCSLNGDDPLLFGPVLLDGVRARAHARWASTTRAAGVDRTGVDRRVGRARRAQGVGATLDRRLARDGLTPA